MRCQKCPKGLKTHSSPDTSVEGLQLFLKTSIVQTCLKSLLGIFKYLLVLTVKKQKRTLRLPKVP